MDAVLFPPGGSSFTSCGSAEGASVSSLLVAPPSVVTMCSVPMAPLSGSLCTPTTTDVAGVVGPDDVEHAASASSALLNRGKSVRKAIRRDELGEPLGLLSMAVEEHHHRKPL